MDTMLPDPIMSIPNPISMPIPNPIFTDIRHTAAIGILTGIMHPTRASSGRFDSSDTRGTHAALSARGPRPSGGGFTVRSTRQKWRSLVSMSLLCLLAMSGCAREESLSYLRADASVLQRQSAEQHQSFAFRLQQLNDQVTSFEKAQKDLQRGVAGMTATVTEVYNDLQRLRGSLEEVQHQRQSSLSGEDLETRLADLYSRLNIVEQHLRAMP